MLEMAPKYASSKWSYYSLSLMLVCQSKKLLIMELLRRQLLNMKLKFVSIET